MKIFRMISILLLLSAAFASPAALAQTETGSEIHQAARRGDLARVKALVETDHGLLEAKTGAGKTPLHFAAEGGRTEVVLYLLDKGAEINARNAESETPLHYAAGYGHMDVINLLLERGADVNARSSQGDTPLHYVRFNGFIPVAQALLDHGADAGARNGQGDTLLVAAFSRGRRDLIDLLLSRGAVVDARGGESLKLLALAVERGQKDLVEMLLSKGVEVKAEGESGNRLLHAAAAMRNREITALLLDGGADVTGLSPSGGTLLHSAAQGGDIDLARSILAGKKIDLNAVDKLGRTALQIGEDWGNETFSEVLRAAGARKTVREAVRIGPAAGPSERRRSVEISYVSNEGFLVVAGGKKVLLDTPYSNPFGYIDTPEPVVEKLLDRSAPFDRLDLMLFSHAHRDHFEPAAASAVLKNHPETLLVGNRITIGELKEAGSGGLGDASSRIREYNPDWGTSVDTEVNGVRLKIFPVNHGAPENPYVTLAYLFVVGGFKILHLGDIAPPSNVEFIPKYGLEKEGIDIAFVDPFFLQDESGKKLLRDHIRPKKIILMHMRGDEVDRYLAALGKEYDNVLAFHVPMQKMVFEK